MVGINQDRHDASIDDVGQGVAVRDDLYLVPLAGFDHRFNSSEVPKCSKQSRLLSRFGGNHLSPPGDDAARRTLLVELAGVFVVVIEVGLIAAKIPLGVLAIEILVFLPLLSVARE